MKKKAERPVLWLQEAEQSRARSQAHRDRIKAVKFEQQYKDRDEYPLGLVQDRESSPGQVSRASSAKRLRPSSYNALTAAQTHGLSSKHQCTIRIKNEPGQCIGTGQHSEVREGQILPATPNQHQSPEISENNRFAMKTLLRHRTVTAPLSRKRADGGRGSGLGKESLIIVELDRRIRLFGGDTELAKAGVRLSKVHTKATAMLGDMAEGHLCLELIHGTTNSAKVYNMTLLEVQRFCHQTLTVLDVFRRANFVHSDISFGNCIFNFHTGQLGLVDMQGSFFIPANNEDSGGFLFDRNGVGANGSDGFRAPCQTDIHALAATQDPFSVDMFAFGMCVLRMLHRGVVPECCKGNQAGQKAVIDGHHNSVALMLETEESWKTARWKMCWLFNSSIRSKCSNDFLRKDSAMFCMLALVMKGTKEPRYCLAMLGGLGSEPLVVEPFTRPRSIIVPGKTISVGLKVLKVYSVMLVSKGDEMGWSVFALEIIPPGGLVCEYGGEVRMT